MIVTAWHDGSPRPTGEGYGVRVGGHDRDKHFGRKWLEVCIELPNGRLAWASVARRSFWEGRCGELVSPEIGRWLLEEGFAPWSDGKPLALELEALEEGRFRLLLLPG